MKPPDRTEISFSLNRSTLVVGLAITAVAILVTFLISYYYNFEVYFRDYIALFTTGIVCTTLFYHSKNIGLTHAYHVEKLSFEREKLKAENERKVAEYSLMICSEWFKPSIGESVTKARVFLLDSATKKNGATGAELIAKIDEDGENRKAVITVLNYFEHVSLLINKRLVDESIMKELFKTIFCDYFRVLKPYIDERQKKSRRIFLNYERIAENWSKD